MKNWPGYCDSVWTTPRGGERLSPSSCPACQCIRKTSASKHYCTTDCPWPSLGYAVLNGIGCLQDTQVQLVGLTVFCLERPNGSTANGTQYNTQWQICIVTADSWLGHQNVSFKDEPSPPLEWGSRFVKTRGGLSVLYLWYPVALPLYIPDSRGVVEEGQTTIVKVVQDM